MIVTSRRKIVLITLALAVIVGVGWFAFHRFLPNYFDREIVNSDEIDKLKTADLSRKMEAGASDEWPQFRGVHRDGWAPSAGMNFDWAKHPPKVKWSVPCGGGYSSFAVVGGIACTMDRVGGNERVLALDAESGAVKWAHEYPADYSALRQGYGEGPRATPTIQDGRCYTVGATGHMICLQLPQKEGGTPAILWEKELLTDFNTSLAEWGMACSPLIEGELVIVQPGGSKGSVAAFHRITGELKWAAGKDPNGYSSPVAATLGGVRQIVAVTGTGILGIRAENGELLWRHPFETAHKANIAMPVIADDYVFVSAGYNKGCICMRVIDTKTEVVYFKPKKLMRNHHSTCVHNNGFLFGFDDEVLRCVNLRKGVEVEDWAADFGREIKKGSLILVGDHLVGLTEHGTLFVATADPANGKLFGKVENALKGSQCWALPVAVNGMIYLRDAEKAVCYEAK